MLMGQKYINNYKCKVHAIPGQWNCISGIGITTNSIIKKETQPRIGLWLPHCGNEHTKC